MVDFSETPPASGLALEGVLARTGGEGDGVDLVFTVDRSVGPWAERAGVEPRLRRLRLRVDAEVAERRFRCDGLELSEAQLALAARSSQLAMPAPALDLTLDTAMAYNWMRFPGYLAWAAHIVGTIRREALPGERPLVADLGGGSGWMSALLKAHLGDGAEVLCTDVAAEALELAKVDAEANGLDVGLALGDLYVPLLERGPPWPQFVYFNPPQVPGTAGEGKWRGSPDVALLAPPDNATLFHTRFLQEAELAPGGVAWLGVNWDLLPEVIRLGCAQGWRAELPPALRDLTSAPSTLLELRKAGPGDDVDEAACVEEAMRQARGAADFQVRAIGARDEGERVAAFRAAAERGVPGGQANLGIAYAMGRGVAADAEAASGWLGRAAAQGNEDAEFQLGRLLASSGPAGAAEAAGWLRRAAGHGHLGAQASLGFLCLAGGEGGAQGAEEGQRWLSKAAARGDARALATLGECYANGIGLEQDDAAAVKWYLRAAEQGDVMAQTNLGLLLAQGRGVPGPDPAAAAVWFQRAAEAGGLSAQLNLGAMCEMGDGVPEDDVAAAQWYRRAAEQGNADAQGRLAAMHFEGRGVEEDEEEGARWLSEAVAQGDEYALELLGNVRQAAVDGDEDARSVLALLRPPEAAPPASGGGSAVARGAARRLAAPGLRLGRARGFAGAWGLRR